jgi:uncharacterized protein YciI
MAPHREEKRMIRLAAAPLVLAAVAAVSVAASAAEMPPNMTTYYFGVLMKGPKWSAEATPEKAKLQEGHMAHLDAMWKAGKLVLAGPLADDGDWRGVLIYRTKTIDEAQRLANDDPAVKAGRFVVTMHPWMIQRDILPDPLEGPPRTEAK